MGILVRITIAFFLFTSSAHAACTYTAGSIVCTLSSNEDDVSINTGTSEMSNTGVGAVPFNDSSRPYFLRYQANVPKNASDVAAKITFKASTTNTSAATAAIKLINEASCPAFSNYATVAALGVTGSVDFVKGASGWVADTSYDATGLGTLVSTWIGLAGYAYGGYIGFKVDASSGTYHYAYAFDDDSPTHEADAPVLTVTFTGGDPVMTVYANYPHSYTKQRIRLALWNTTAGQKVKVLLDDVAVSGYPAAVTAGTTTSGDQWIEVDYTGLTAGSHTLKISITDASDVEFASTLKTISWTTTHNGAPTVGLDEYNNFILNGTTKFFPISGWQPSYSTLDSTPTYSMIDAVNTISCIASYSDFNLANWQDLLTRSDQASVRTVGPIKGSYWTTNMQGRVLLTQSFAETFEGAGYVLGACGTTNCWTETGAVNEDYGTALVGSQSAELDGTGSAATLSYTMQEDAYRVRVTMALNETTDHAAQDIVSLKKADGTVLGKVTWNDNGTMTVTQGTATATSVATYSSGTTYYLWLDWITATPAASPGLDEGVFKLYVNTSDSLPGSAAAAILDTNDGTGLNGTVHTIELSANGSKIVYDRVQDWMDALDDYVDGSKSGYDAMFAWSWVDEPDLGGSAKYATADIIKAWHDRVKTKDTSHPTWVSFVGYDFGDLKQTALHWTYGPGTNAASFSNVPTAIADVIGCDYYPYEYINNTSLNTTLEDWLSAMDNINTVAGLVQPIVTVIENGDVHDNYATYYLEVSNVSGSFTKGDTITATSGGNCTIPTTTGPTIATYVRSGTSPQLILCNNKTGTFGVGDTLTATSGGTATYASVSSTKPCGWAKTYEWSPGPTDAQLKNMMWLGIIHGLKGITYFDSFCSAGNVIPASAKTTLETFKSDVEGLVDAISGTPSSTFNDAGKHYKAITTGDARVDAMVRTVGSTTYIFSARVKQTAESPAWPDDSDNNIVSAIIPVVGLASGSLVTVYGEDRTLTAGDATITDNFTDYDVHIYTFDGTPSPATGTGAQSLSGGSLGGGAMR